MPELTPQQWLDQITVVSDDGIRIGPFDVPGLIAEGGINIVPSSDGLNRLHVEFLVGTVHAEGPKP